MEELSYNGAIRKYCDTLREDRRDDLRGKAEVNALGALIDIAADTGRKYGLQRAVA